MKNKNFVTTEILKITQEEAENILQQLQKVYENKAEIDYKIIYDDEYYQKTDCKYWYNITSNVTFNIKISTYPLTYKARNKQKITDFDTITLTMGKSKGKTNEQQNVINYNFSFKNNGNLNKGVFEINPHYFYNDDLREFENILNEYHNELYNYLPDENTKVYTRKEFATAIK